MRKLDISNGNWIVLVLQSFSINATEWKCVFNFNTFLPFWNSKLIENQTFFLFTDEFRSKVACENDVIQLMCNPYSRIAVYGASYGRTEYESLQCAQPSGVKEESKLISLKKLLNIPFIESSPTACLVSYSTETVMKICHGQRKCSLTADSNTFGKPCKPDTRMYLKVVYTCGKIDINQIELS